MKLMNSSLVSIKTLRTMLAVIIFVVLFNCFCAIQNGDYQYTSRYKLVRTLDGTVRGRWASDGSYLAFLGIPYAAPPIGSKRFKSPEPPKSWKGTFDAVRTVKCPQRGEGDEDCLIVNIFTPLQTPNRLLPVLVYIHGGSFLTGSGPTEGMGPLVKQKIIIVTLNYRLGALGFLCLGIEKAPGNAGLKDQVAALTWIKRNIESFSGNPNDVTIYGMSAGGASVEHLVLSHMPIGLFSKAIIESGSATNVWATDPNPLKTAHQMGRHLNFPVTKSVDKLFQYYKDVDVETLTEINYQYYSNLTDGTFGFVPCVERKLDNVEAVIKESPHKILKNENYVSVPITFLFTSLEGLHLRSAEYFENHYKERMKGNFLSFMPADLVIPEENLRIQIANNVRRFYCGNSTDFGMMPFLRYSGDCLILHGLLHSAYAHALRGNSVYLMEFAYKGGLVETEKNYEEINMAGHGDIVKHAILNRPLVDENDKLIVRRVTALIGNFVKHGNPVPSVTSLLPVEWEPIEIGDVSYLYLDSGMKIRYNPHEKMMAIWAKLYSKFRLQIEPVRSG